MAAKIHFLANPEHDTEGNNDVFMDVAPVNLPASARPSETGIPFGLHPLPETTRIAETHRNNEKAMRQPAKRNLRPARADGNPFIVLHRLIVKRAQPRNGHALISHLTSFVSRLNLIMEATDRITVVLGGIVVRFHS